MLAQIQPSPAELAAWIACLVFVVMGINQVMVLVSKFRGDPPSEQLKLTSDALDKRVTAVEQFQQRCPVEQREGRHQIYQRMDKDQRSMQECINELGCKVAGLSAKMETSQQMQAAMNSKLDRLAERLPHK